MESPCFGTAPGNWGVILVWLVRRTAEAPGKTWHTPPSNLPKVCNVRRARLGF
ncbi:MAG TPA: hypothetical protein VKU19_11765 [Bryobacteraceae bacterium]|nr:hypothetical protein [Bryobacteraceae bacterium]